MEGRGKKGGLMGSISPRNVLLNPAYATVSSKVIGQRKGQCQKSP